MTTEQELNNLKQAMVGRARKAAFLLGVAIVVTLICMIYGFIQSSKASLAVEQTIRSAEEIQLLRIKIAECNSTNTK